MQSSWAEYKFAARPRCHPTDQERMWCRVEYLQKNQKHSERGIWAMEQHRNVFLSKEQVDCRNFPPRTQWFRSFPYQSSLLVSSRQAISCLKKALWLCPLNFNVLYNLGVVLMTAHQFASAFQCFVSAVSIRADDAESFMMLASRWQCLWHFQLDWAISFPPAVCLFYLNDSENAQIAFRKSILSTNAIRNPLIYLNYSIFCLVCLRNADETSQYLNNFYNLCETMKVPPEVSFKLTVQRYRVLINHSFICSTSR